MHQYIPNTYAHPRKYPHILNRHIRMHSSIIIACQYIYPGDEIYVDYRLGPDLPIELLPAGYRHVDKVGARSRFNETPRPMIGEEEEGEDGKEENSVEIQSNNTSSSTSSTSAISISGDQTNGTNVQENVDTMTHNSNNKPKMKTRLKIIR